MTPFGSRIHAPWAMAIASRLAEHSEFDAQPLWTDDGIMFRFADADRLPPASFFLPDPDEIEERIVSELAHSPLFASQFRENAARALLLPRRRPGARTPLWVQRLRSQNLQAVARAFPDFPIMLETYRSCIQDIFDVPGLIELMQGVRSRSIRVDDVETPSASPFARSLVFAYTATYLYQLDMPVAERKTQALSLDRPMLRELLGAEALRELLDPGIIDGIEARLQGLDAEFRVRHADGLHDLLRRVGDLSEVEILARFDGDTETFETTLSNLLRSHRAVEIELGNQKRLIAAEDASIYRDALGVELPRSIPSVFLESSGAPLEQLLMRYSRNHAPFTSSRAAIRFGLVPAQIEPIFEVLANQGRILSGEFDPRGRDQEWCEPEVLRRIKRGTLNRLREQISPVDGAVLSRFLLDWHGVGVGRPGSMRLDEVIDQLEGLPMSFVELEQSILPARMGEYAPSMLDALGALGQIVWVGRGSIGDKDGRVVLYRRDRISALVDSPAEEIDLTPAQELVLAHLENRGASFFEEIVQALGAQGSEKLFEALWGLVWAGLVTNDTFAPLRALGQKASAHRKRRRRPPPSATAGRWSLVAPLLDGAPSSTARLHARALLYLDRHGVVSRDSMSLEPQFGGFASVYPMLREMEETGRVRRGHFVEGMSSAQFAAPGAVDRLRALRLSDADDEPRGVLLAVTDPAQPYGSTLDWPPTRRGVGRPRRAVGAGVVLVDGRLALFIDGGGQRVMSFEDESCVGGQARIESALRAWVAGAERIGKGRIGVEEIDGERARSSALAPLFVRAGFRMGYRGLELDRLRLDHSPQKSSLGAGRAIEHDSIGAHEESSDDRDG